jgi:hypothetical protein
MSQIKKKEIIFMLMKNVLITGATGLVGGDQVIYENREIPRMDTT